ncbi:hypothetical protein CA3LBN_000370 [Candidozyma haemuli]|uniref:Protein kinase domain-containing protein n=2 Tax=Candidozyma TaxID=3303203 RepID=A0ABX8I003_9ASCO|nr:hypothetical protein CA3LBN_000370 [[Candida] haemuloni]
MADFETYKDKGFHVPRRYKIVKELGSGSYGTVCSVIDTKDDRNVKLAVKKVSRIFENPILIKRAIRELRLMTHLRGNRHIVSLVDVHFVKDTYPGLYCFQELMDWDLTHVLFSPMQLSEFHIQSFFYQILQGLKYTHSANIIHRDLKPGNILVDRHGTLKIADFGLARGITTSPAASCPITNYVATRWYRAPELLLREKHYGKEVDMWAVGVILGEMYGRRPLLPGKDTVGQMVRIIDLLGEPDKNLVKKRGWKLPCSSASRNVIKTRPASSIYPILSTTMGKHHDDLDIIKFIVNFEDGSSREVPVADVDEVIVSIPEGTTYQMSIVFKVSNRTLKGLKYKQVVKKGGIPLKTRELYIGDEFAPSEEYHTKQFEKDTTPSGFLYRGKFPSTSTYFAGDEELFTSDWTLEVTKKA